MRKKIQCESSNQPQNMRLALDLFKSSVPRPERYGLMLITRHDVVWTRRITHWPVATNFSRLNFLSGCEPRCVGCRTLCHRCKNMSGVGSKFGGEPRQCVQDVMHMMPGQAFSAFDHSVGVRGSRCFDGYNKGSGHGCFRVLEERLGPTGFVLPLDYWRPVKDVREYSPVCHLQQPFIASPRRSTVSQVPQSTTRGRTGVPASLRATSRRNCGQVCLSPWLGVCALDDPCCL